MLSQALALNEGKQSWPYYANIVEHTVQTLVHAKKHNPTGATVSLDFGRKPMQASQEGMQTLHRKASVSQQVQGKSAKHRTTASLIWVKYSIFFNVLTKHRYICLLKNHTNKIWYLIIFPEVSKEKNIQICSHGGVHSTKGQVQNS